jgi:inner membrane protein
MDPLSQACLGASLSQSFAQNKTSQRGAMVIGALAGMAPDLDVLIRSTEDPMLFLEFHRQFTHSLFFIPFGALLCALLFYFVIKLKWFKSELTFLQIYLFSFLGYATHGLLDACTSYGTQLFWPFSNVRIAWNTVSIIDPLFTLPVIAFVLLALFKKNVHYARMGFAYAVIYLSLGLIQHNRAEQALFALASERGHVVERSNVKPSFGNRHLWKMIYESNGRYYVDAVKLLIEKEYITGDSIKKLDIKRDFPWLPEDSQQAIDIERFRWFSDDFLAVSKDDEKLIVDMRYSFLPNSIKPMWGIEVNKILVDEGDMDAHVFYEMKNELDTETRKRFIEMLF